MTTDITELAQRMKAAAEKATPGQWERGDGKHGGELLVYCDDALGSAVCEATSEYNAIPKYQRIDNLDFIAMASPANVLALVEELEKAQTEVKRQENIASALFDEVSQLRRNADDKAHELNKIITEMEEENNRQVLEVMRLSSLVAELESRTVTVKLPPRIDTSNVQFAGYAWNCCIDEVEKRLTAAGIKWEAE
ncbi:ead/Ea22-like family protein [Klebsiella grimontii]|uniref:ead/Ea22-like family protein n=1 Tax=Klebsiella grimontii TaxID=2058152 RepID=UPI002247D636|nr:ead/Ea22-like family protein [Klebsiella grimontii]MCW9528763.1 ead/Ea22-like family protein [Klebsiella grimontii]